MSDTVKSVDSKTNSGLLILAGSTSFLSFNSFHEYESLQYQNAWGGWLALASALGVAVGFYLFWSLAFKYLPAMDKEQRRKCYPYLAIGFVMIAAASTQTSFNTAYLGTAQLAEQQDNAARLKEISDQTQLIARIYQAQEPVIRAAQENFKLSSDQEACCGAWSSVEGEGGVSRMFDDYALKAQNLADAIANSRGAIESLIDEIQESTASLIEIIADPSIDESIRESTLSAETDQLRSLVIELKQVTSPSGLRNFVEDLTSPLVMPALSNNPELARRQRETLLTTLPAIFSKVGKSLERELEEIEAVSNITPPVFEFKTSTELVWAHWNGGVNVLAAMLAIDFLPLVLLGLTCQWEDSKRMEASNQNQKVYGKCRIDDLALSSSIIKRARKIVKEIDDPSQEDNGESEVIIFSDKDRKK